MYAWKKPKLDALSKPSILHKSIIDLTDSCQHNKIKLQKAIPCSQFLIFFSTLTSTWPVHQDALPTIPNVSSVLYYKSSKPLLRPHCKQSFTI